LRRLVHNLALKQFGDAVFTYALYVGKPNIWRSARDGIALFAESAEKLTKSAIRVYVMGLLTWVVFAVPIFLATRSIFQWADTHKLPTVVAVTIGLLAAAWVLKIALFDPVAIAWTFSVFLRQVDDVGVADEAWAERLEQKSKRFRELNDRAKAFAQQPSDAKPPPPAKPKPPPEADDQPEPDQDPDSSTDDPED